MIFIIFYPQAGQAFLLSAAQKKQKATTGEKVG